ncbi:DNA translocase FtsK [Halomonas sp. 328]|uniref:DNA translocase FtsK n=1 Tax=Halomonas sp. 328 TaxID=2776704 RepID=UPI0018A7B8BA|nr:DNA translocase FtsK 4TM domain-containing protein [Halomonas sp. 328]MBF8223818.1 DNA translocase FtsK 4TM domain-containing protein [Halomonas sp. 328]
MSVDKKTTGRRVSTQQAKEQARRFGVRLQGASREGAVILLLAGCVFLLLALFSYQPGDPGWSHSGPESRVANWMGPIGAWLADVLYSLFGASALWWPGMLGFAAWRLLRTRRLELEWDATALAVRLGGLVLLLLGTTTLGALHFFNPDSNLPYAVGGILGEGLMIGLAPLVGAHGTTLLALVALLCGLPLFSGLSWLALMDELGHRALRLAGRLWRWIGGGRDSEREDPPEAPLSKPEVPQASEAEAARPWWRRWLPRRETPQLAEAAGMAAPRRAEPSLEGETEIPWEVPAHTPSAKDPEAAYTRRFAEAPESPETRDVEATPGPGPAQGLSARRDEPEAPWSSGMALRAEPADTAPPRDERPAEPATTGGAASPGEDDERLPAESGGEVSPEASRDPVAAPASEAPVETGSDEPRAEQDAEPTREASSAGGAGMGAIPASASAVAAERREPRLVSWSEAGWDDDDDEPTLMTPRAEAQEGAPGSEARSTPVAAPEGEAEPRPDAPSASFPSAEEVASREAEPLDLPATPEGLEEDAPRLATAEQGRAAAGEGPTLWTVEHLQNQRPLFEDLGDPEGEVPSVRLLTPPEAHEPNYTPEQLASMAELLEVRLREYGVKAEVVETWPGPVITRFEIKPAAGVKVSKISNLAKDLARSLMVKSVRVVEIIPGRPTVGIEIPNPKRAMIRLREVLDSDRYLHEASPLALALGQDIGGAPVVANLGKMPHLLVAGTTGSGKSVGVNAMLISMLLKATPEELRLIMVDPKMLELSVYDGIPHLLAPVVTDMKEAANGLRWCVAEMERRYKLMAAMGVRNIAGFNAKLDEAARAGAQVADPLWEPQPWQMHESPPVLEKLPYIVVVIDEFADMFMIVGKKVEELIARLAQKARAAGIHLILATQRPSVDVVTGLIKANIPTRIAFQVSSKVDSRTILDQGGAENLLGHGDMLYLPPGAGLPMRVHGAFVDDDEVHRVVEDWKRRGEPEYIDEILSGGVSAEALAGLEAEGVGEGDDAEQDALYDEAVQFVTESRRASISAVQRRFKIGYNRAARLVEAMEMAGVVSTMGTNGGREVLAPPPVND